MILQEVADVPDGLVNTTLRDALREAKKKVAKKKLFIKRTVPTRIRVTPENIRTYRYERDLGQSDLAKLVGVHYTTVGRSKPDARYAYKLRKLFRGIHDTSIFSS